MSGLVTADSLIDHIANSSVTAEPLQVHDGGHCNLSCSPDTEPQARDELSLTLQQGMMTYAQFVTTLTGVRIVGLILSSMALYCSFISVAVFRRLSLQNSTTVLVIAFNVFEGAKTLFYIMYRLVKVVMGETKVTWSSAAAQYFAHVVTWIPDAMGRIGLLINGVITIDRFIILTFPLKFVNKPLVLHPKLVVFVIALTMVLYQVSIKIIFQVLAVPRLDYSANFTTDEILSVIAIQAPGPFKIYRTLIVYASILFHYLPLVVGLVFNLLTIISLVRHQKARLSLTHSADAGQKEQQQKKQTNVMIVGSSLAFSVLVAIKPVVRLISVVVPDFGDGKREAYLYVIINECSLMFDNISCLVNLIFYCRLSTNFRRILRKMIQPSVSSIATQISPTQ